MMKTTFFIADLHLSDDTPKLNALFVQFMNEHAPKADALYILGDLFEAWIGDDNDSETAKQVAQTIKQFSQFAPVYFIAGNRDFLVGKDFAQRANMTLLPEQTVIKRYQQRLLLTHGDEMCLDDVVYQRYRRVMRNGLVRFILCHLPLKWRKQIAAKLRDKSRSRKVLPQNYQVADVSEQGIQAAYQRFAPIDVLIHGHTHRPDVHIHSINQNRLQRYVLPDWREHDNKCGFLALNEHGITFGEWLFMQPENHQQESKSL